MACSNYTLGGYTTNDCDSSKGGVIEVFIINYDAISAVGVVADSGTTDPGKVSGFTMNTGTTAPQDTDWHRYQLKRNTGSMTSTLNVDETAGVNYVNTDVLIRFNKLNTTARIEMTALTLAETRVVVHDANGKYWLVGKDEPVVASAGSGQTGVQKTDGSYFELTLQGSDNTYPLELTDAAIAQLTA